MILFPVWRESACAAHASNTILGESCRLCLFATTMHACSCCGFCKKVSNAHRRVCTALQQRATVSSCVFAQCSPKVSSMCAKMHIHTRKVNRTLVATWNWRLPRLLTRQCVAKLPEECLRFRAQDSGAERVVCARNVCAVYVVFAPRSSHQSVVIRLLFALN